MTFALFACGSSLIDGSGGGSSTTTGGGTNVGFDPSISSNLEVIPYQVISDRLLTNFKLTTASEAYKTLVANVAIFDVADPKFNSVFQTAYIKVMSQACENMDTATFFPDNKPVIDNIWRSMTGRSPSEGGAKDIEASMLSDTAGQTVDVQIFAVCMGAVMDARSEFINFRD